MLKELSKIIARDIFRVGDEPGRKTSRIEFKAGTEAGDELNNGGFCESALATHIETILNDNLKVNLTLELVKD